MSVTAGAARPDRRAAAPDAARLEGDRTAHARPRVPGAGIALLHVPRRRRRAAPRPLGGAGHAQRDEQRPRPGLRGLQGADGCTQIDRAIGSRRVSVAVGEDDAFLYDRAASTPRTPASNEKLLLSMTLYDTFGADFRITTSVAASGGTSGAVRNLWILGQGDPGVSPATLGALARRVADAGIERVRGRVFGSTGYFRRDWDAPGWNNVARDYVNRPTALVFDRNAGADPEREAAKTLTTKLEALGVPRPRQARERETAGRARDDRVGPLAALAAAAHEDAPTVGQLRRRDARQAARGRDARRARGRSRRARPRSRPGRTLTGRGSRSTTTPACRTRTA